MDYPEKYKQYWEVFKDHIIKNDGPDSYVYHNLGSRFYLCCIQFRHGYIIIYGDMGPFVLYTGHPNALSWAKGSVDSPEYVMGKLKIVNKEFDLGETKESFKEIAKDFVDTQKVINSIVLIETEEEAISVAEEYNIDPEAICYTWDATPEAQWAYWIIRTFIDKLEESEKNDKEKS